MKKPFVKNYIQEYLGDLMAFAKDFKMNPTNKYPTIPYVIFISTRSETGTKLLFNKLAEHNNTPNDYGIHVIWRNPNLLEVTLEK